MAMNPYASPPWVLPVAAGDKQGKVADFSSRGIEADTVGLGFASVDVAGETRRPLAMGLYHPAVTTTGVDVVSTRANNTIVPLTGTPRDVRTLPPEEVPYYTTLSGTSMASPETAGVVALVLEAAPELTPAQVRMVLQITARPIPDAPFHSAGYGYTDASAAVELALGLHGRGAPAIQDELNRLQTTRDQEVLAGLAHPDHSWAWTDTAPALVGSVSHTVPVSPGTARLKVISNGGAVPFVGAANYEITVTDAAGEPVGSAAAANPSGATILDVDLAKVKGVTFGDWTVEVFALGSPGGPSTGLDEFGTKRFINILISAFGPQPDLCHAGGLTEVKKIAAMAEASYVRVAPHNASGPIGTAAAVHLDAAIPNFLIQEYFVAQAPWIEEVVAGGPRVVDGEIVVPDRPGLGVELSEAAALAHPFREYWGG
ncbi:MAG: enolase C-terminal domain-like protein, partial [Acidimicrobiia bacterium]